MSTEQLGKTLHPFERAVLPLLATTTSTTPSGSRSILFSELLQKSKLKDVEVMRALEWLENKKLLTKEKRERSLVYLGNNGSLYQKTGLPERRAISTLKEKPLTLKQLKKAASLDAEELNAALGTLRRLQAITITKDKETTITLTSSGSQLLTKETPEEAFLKKEFPLHLKKIKEQDKFAFEQLQKRKDMILTKEETDWEVTITNLGSDLIKLGVYQKDQLGRLLPSTIISGDWKKKEFRPYDVTINVPSLHPGKKHIVTQAIEYIKRIWLELGFKEMQGNIIQTAFWDLDALFVPQDHPARDMQDTFYLASPEHGALPPLSAKVKATHESGSTTGSTGWRGHWSEQEAKQLLLRTHTTVLSAQTLAKLKQSDLPAKFFAVGKVFRNETLDYSHLFEFYQVEGIVIDPNANMKHLKGYLREFYRKMGYPDVRIRPAHFPYTEPSCEVEVFHPVKKKWLELGGAGIFRPEVVIPLLGKDIPVLAWGLGLDRIISSYYAITDIRDLYKNDLKQLREAKLWVK